MKYTGTEVSSVRRKWKLKCSEKYLRKTPGIGIVDENKCTIISNTYTHVNNVPDDNSYNGIT